MTASAARLPDHLPILDRHGARRVREPVYVEREITAAVDVCDARGRLNPAAVGFARSPLFRANLAGHWPRKKRWNFWNWIGPECVFSVTLADIDLASFCAFTLTDLRDGLHRAGAWYGLPGRIALSEEVEQSVAFTRGAVEYACRIDGDDLAVRFRGRADDGTAIAADLAVRRPPGQESLNVVVPWSASRFQCNSKHAALPCAGEVRGGERVYRLDPRTCFAVQDWGRGVWPYRSFWNWGVATGWAGDVLLGVNVGGKWTTGTGVNENGILCDGRLHKIMEDLRWEYDPTDWRKPWRVVAEHSGAIDLVLAPLVAHTPRLDLIVLATGGVCAFGRWSGRVRVAGREISVDGLLGWAEEFAHRW
ncbi:MAG TPA: DUF2804 domain-containing protein [Candidatus Binatia bacterium]|nr:DUF2804 domain-containing protein [Candidatus Binatia bacterium]